MKKSLLLLIPILILFSCKKRENMIHWNIDGIAPVVYGELSIYDILPDSVVVSNMDSSVSMSIALNLFRLDLDSLVAIPDTSLLDTFALPFPFPVTAIPGQVFINQPEDNNMNVGSAELTYVEIKSGTIEYQLESTIQGKIIYEYQIPVAIDANGNSFSQLVYVSAAVPGITASASGSFDLSGYSINLSGSSANSFNIIQTNVNIKVDPTNATDVSVSNQDTVYIRNELSNIKIDYAKGYFGNQSFIAGPEKTSLTAFNNLISGNLNIDQIDVDLELVNGIGADASITFNSLTASNNNSEIALDHSIIGNNININRANEIGPTISPYYYTTVLNNSNSNIDYMLELLPDSIGYGLALELNPLGNISAHNDFISSDAPMELNMDIKLPLSIIANNLTLADTLNIDISDTTGLHSVMLSINLENGFPLEAQLDLVLLDQNNMVVSHVLSPTLVPTASLDGNGVVSGVSTSTHQLTLSQKDFKILIQNKKIVLKIIFNTPISSSHIDIYDYYKLKFNVVANFEYGVVIE
jgi:hypothetical protein